MGRITSLMLLAIFVTLSSVHCAQLSVNFVLEDSTAVSDTVPRGAFATLELKEKYRGTMQKSLPEVKAEEKEGCVTMELFGLPDKAAYTRFKSLWSTDSAPGTEESEESSAAPSYLMYYVTAAYEWFKSLWSNAPSIDSMDITAKEFLEFMFAASYLDIQGEYAERFAQNMAKYGLLGAHSADIVSSEVFSNYDLPQKTLWDFLHAFLRQAEFEYRLVHPSTGQIMLRIEKADAWPKQIDEEYTGPSQTTRMRTVLHTELGPALSQEKERNEAVLAWLLQNIGGSSVDIQYYINLSSEGTIALTQAIKQFTKGNEQGARVYVEGLTLKIENDSFILHSVLQLVPGLSRLEFANTLGTPSREAPSSLISDISLCTSLKALTITNYILKSAEVGSIADSHPNIEQLSIWCKPLEETAMDSLKKCTRLERLKISGWYHSSTTLQALVKHLPLLKELSIGCNILEPVAAEAFQACTKLEILKMWGVYQPSTVVQALLTHIPFLKELSIECDVLEPAAAEAFQACTKLEILKMWGEDQPSTVVQALLTHIPFLKELSIECNVLEPVAAEAFQACTKLEILKINGELQPSPAIQALLTHIPFLKELSIKCDVLEPAAAEAFQACTKLEKLNMMGLRQPSATVQAIVTHLPSLKELNLGIDSADFALADALRNCSNLRTLNLTVENYTPGFLARYLKAPLPRLTSLKLRNNDINHWYSEEDKRAVKKAQELEMSISAYPF
ncbi:hypothetical protein NECID01_1500 [Nematocida sp. AWRm77]|nr:hypothetical protein NECID01_1500 [Nematocida sp. AWRm77]